MNALKLKAKMVETDIDKYEMAKRLNVSYATLNRKINGYTSFTIDEAKSIKDILNLSNDEAIYIFLN